MAGLDDSASLIHRCGKGIIIHPAGDCPPLGLNVRVGSGRCTGYSPFVVQMPLDLLPQIIWESRIVESDFRKMTIIFSP